MIAVPTAEQSKDLARRFMDEVFAKRNLEYADQALADDFIEHNPFPGLGADKKGALQSFEAIFGMSSDMSFEIHHLIASGDRVAIHATFRGTDTGGAMPGIPATNKPYEMDGIDIVRVNDDGSFAEHWGLSDAMGMMMQLGLMPSPGADAG